MYTTFPFILVMLVFFSGLISLYGWLRKRHYRRKQLEDATTDTYKPSAPVELATSVFPVLLLVLLIRSFILEPFRIPSGSMKPTLDIGDFILVSKFSYGLRLPVIGTNIFPINDPKCGDVMVFKQPGNEGTNFIKRVIGTPGDKISYYNKVLYVNGKRLPQEFIAQLIDTSAYRLFKEGDAKNSYTIRKDAFRDNIGAENEWLVPEHMYFVVGDNRDHSHDSRFWGFVPEKNIIGKAFYVWMNWPKYTQLPSFKNNGFIL